MAEDDVKTKVVDVRPPRALSFLMWGTGLAIIIFVIYFIFFFECLCV